MAKKVLVIGRDGQLGQSLKLCTQNLSGPAFEFVGRSELDLTQPKQIQAFFQSRQFDYIINCAAFTAVDKAEEASDLAEAINHRAVKQIAQIAKETDTVLIHISTDYVFDGTQCRPYVESDATNPLGVYGETKLKGEQAIRLVKPLGCIIRTSWVFSQFGNNFVKTMLRLSEQQDTLKVVGDQIGSPTYAVDLANAIITLISHYEKHSMKPEMTVYHFSNEGVASWYDFACAIFELSGLENHVVPIESSEFPTVAKRPFFSVLNKRKIKVSFDLSIPHWRKSLKKCMGQLQKTV